MNAAPQLPEPPIAVTPRRFLWIGLGVSLLVHAAVLALRFAPPQPPPRTAPMSLEVVLLNLRSEATPEQPTALAQTASAGGGDHDAGLAASPLPAWAGDTQLPSPPAGAPEPLAAERALLTQARGDVAVEPGSDSPGQPAPVPSEASQASEAGATAEFVAQLHQQYAVLSQRLQEASQRPRRHYYAPSTSPWMFAEYVEQWRDTVETLGNRHYPPQLRGRYYGSLQLTVVIRADGTLAAIEIDTPSIHPEINDAARAIVQRAAPFPPFPDALRREADVLSITRTWHFENDALTTQTP